MFQQSSIRHIIFDFGGVLINLDYTLTNKTFRALGFDIDKHFTHLQQSNLFNEYETGKVSSAFFYETLRQLGGNHLTDEQLAGAWNAMILDLPLERVALLKELKKKYNLYLLSNTNQTHYEAFMPYLNRLLGEGGWELLFNKVYYSHQIGLRKPDKEIFDYVVADATLQPQHCLYLDDLEKNLVAPAAMGMQTLLVKEKPVTELLKELI
ncbi:MAG: HAD family phosphatase [Bacteroidia bacterium]|nr:HAD family phosphatase [Bacteroidia bacterium]